MKVFCKIACAMLAVLMTLCLQLNNSAIAAFAESSPLVWEHKFGGGWDNCLSSPIVKDGVVVVFSGEKAYKLDLLSGRMLAEKPTGLKTGFNVCAPTVFSVADKTYIVNGFSGGEVACFDFDSLELVWSFKTEMQSLSPILYHNGMLFVGFWADETLNGELVCLNAQNGKEVWNNEHIGGFYWSKGVVIDNLLIIGGDDGVGNAGGILDAPFGKNKLLAFDINSGEKVSEVEVVGDIRCEITYLNERSELLFVTKCGYIYSVLVENGNLTMRGAAKLMGEQSTATVRVYNDKIYVTSGSANSKRGYVEVRKLADLSVEYFVETEAYPQNGVALVPKGESADVYFNYNGLPGGIKKLRVDESTNTAFADDYFIPKQELSEFCIGELFITDKYLVYKNDSNTVFCLEITPSFGAVLTNQAEKIFVKSYDKNTINRVIAEDLGKLKPQEAFSMLLSIETEYGLASTEYSSFSAFYAETLELFKRVEAINAEIKDVCADVKKISLADYGRVKELKGKYDALSPELKLSVRGADELERAFQKVNTLRNASIITVCLSVAILVLTALVIINIVKRRKRKLSDAMPESDE